MSTARSVFRRRGATGFRPLPGRVGNQVWKDPSTRRFRMNSDPTVPQTGENLSDERFGHLLARASDDLLPALSLHALEPSMFWAGGTDIVIDVTGELRSGDNLVLVYNASGGVVRRAVDIPADQVFPGGGVPAPGSCIVPPPTTADCGAAGSGTCDPTPSDTLNCGYNNCSPPACQTWYWWMGDQVCAACGTSITESHCLSWTGGVSAKISVRVSGGGVEVGADGSVSGSSCKTFTVQGGYCSRAYTCMRICSTFCEAYCIIGTGHKKFFCANDADGDGKTDAPTGTMSCQFKQCPP